jgi:AcrR family transcriptional regulator
VRSYHHGNLRAALIDTAVEQARGGGAAAVVLRDAARRTGVSHNAAYRHFADREELLDEVAARGMAALEEAMRGQLARVTTDDPVERAWQRLAATGRGYVQFALAEPGLFDTAFCLKQSPPPGESPYGILGAALDELVEVGALPAERRPGAELTCWAAVHGFASLVLTGPLRELPPAAREAELEGLLERIARGL